jgi:SAM-dependent methyltransferase
MTEWFEQWFGEAYLRLYPHRDDEDAARLAALIDSHVPVRDRDVLDLACGPGRHVAQLQARGARVVGFDLSMPLLSRARHREGNDAAHFVRGDMRRLPFRSARFDLVVNLFTSFGFFSNDAQHQLVIDGAVRVLRPGGAFVIDYLNAAWVVHTLVPLEQRRIGEQRVTIERQVIDGDRFVMKQFHLESDGRSFIERVRLFSPADLATMIDRAGLRVTDRFGDYDGIPLTDEAPRAILIAETS